MMDKLEKTAFYLLFALFFSGGALFCMLAIAVVKYIKTESTLCINGVLYERKINDIFENTGKQCVRISDAKV